MTGLATNSSLAPEEFIEIPGKDLECELGKHMAVAPFRVYRRCINIREFASFCRQTRYRTVAERAGGGSYLANELIEHLVIEGRPEACAFCLSYLDAREFCAWNGVALPSEWQWLAMSICDEAIYEYAHPEKCPWVDARHNIVLSHLPSAVQFTSGDELTDTREGPGQVVLRNGPKFFRWDDWRECHGEHRLVLSESEWNLTTAFRVVDAR